MKKFIEIGMDIAGTMVPAISVVEQAVKANSSGDDKRKAVLEMVKMIPDIAELMRHEDIIDKHLFESGIEKVNDGYVDIMNAIQSSSQD